MSDFDPSAYSRGHSHRFHSFQDLMPHRVHDILLVSSVYDSFILEEDGQLDEGLINEYMDLNLVHLPRMLRASSGSKAVALAKEDRGFDLIISTMRLGDMHAPEFAREVRRAGLDVPLVLLSYDHKELQELIKRHGRADFTKMLLWQGDFRILLAIVKFIEDRANVDFDTNLVGVQSIIVIEDNVRFYSAFLPLLYTELMRHSQNVLSESLNLSHRILRMRARPKILLCETFEEAWDYFEKYHDNVLGVISDIRFPRDGTPDDRAGVEFARSVRAVHPDIPILLQSSDVENSRFAEALGVSFVQKGSPLMLNELRQFLVDHLSFGDFVFRTEEGVEVGRAHDLKSLEKRLAEIPDESLLFHAKRNHFSNWLKARTEFWLAHQLRPRQVEDFESPEELRKDIVTWLRDFRTQQQQGIVVDYDAGAFDSANRFARIGGGSLGGKGRWLAFVNMLVASYGITDLFDGVDIRVPPTIVLGTDVFDRFLDRNDLHNAAVNSEDEADLERRFLDSPLPAKVVDQLRSFLRVTHTPLAVRSSSLLEDSQHQPFAGIYATFMLPNDQPNIEERLADILTAIKLVYLSTFSAKAKAYMRAISYRLEEEKMAVVIQHMAGRRHEGRFYPDFAGVARSHNFYPVAPMKSEDGIASVALGLGAQVVEGGATLRFCPKYPRHVLQFSSVQDALDYSQRDFFALELGGERPDRAPEGWFRLVRHPLSTAEGDGVLWSMGSTYSPENEAVYDGISRPGVRLVSFAPILKNEIFPLAEVLQFLLTMGRWSMSASVEIEFAVNLRARPGDRHGFSILQMRPMVVNHEMEEVSTADIDPARVICESDKVLGNGTVTGLEDIVMVDLNTFDRSRSREVAHEIAILNHTLSSQGIGFLLVGVGRWGSSDPWLGIPVTWDEISGARVIVESSFKDLRVTPSQGSHFFQNLATMRVGYFTVDGHSGGKHTMVDWDWLYEQPVLKSLEFTRHIRMDRPLTVKMDGRTNHGVILKPKKDPAG